MICLLEQPGLEFGRLTDRNVQTAVAIAQFGCDNELCSTDHKSRLASSAASSERGYRGASGLHR